MCAMRFGACLSSTQQKLPKAAGVDLTEHRFNRLLAQMAAAASCRADEAPTHCHGARLATTTFDGCASAALFAGRHVGMHFIPSE